MSPTAPSPASWLSLDTVEASSRSHHDPVTVAAARRDAHRLITELPVEANPLYSKYGYFGEVDLAGIDPVRPGEAVGLPAVLPNTVRVVHDASGTRFELPSTLRADGVRVDSLTDVWGAGSDDPMTFLGEEAHPTDRLGAVALATLNRGYRLTVPDGAPRAVHVQELSVLNSPHLALSIHRRIEAGNSTSVLHVEEVQSSGPVDHQRLYASSTTVTAGADSHVASLTVHAPDRRAVSIYDRRAELGDRARLGWTFAGFGGFRTKVRNRSTLRGNGGDLEDLQSFYGDTDQQYDTAVRVEHVGTDTHGQSITRGVYTDRARGMSRGLVRIEPPARRTLSYLSEHAMLLSPSARSDTNPDLEILCRDVKATHSSSVAPVDLEKRFYLESRGIPAQDAVRMIGEGFLSHVLDRSPIDGLRDLLYPYLAARWEGGDVYWDPHRPSTLPALGFSRGSTGPDWRFDTKLR